jgi:O-antigen ligase
MNAIRKFLSNSLNVVVCIVIVLTITGLINLTAAFFILLLTVLFHIEDHLRRILTVVSKPEKDNAGS